MTSVCPTSERWRKKKRRRRERRGHIKKRPVVPQEPPSPDEGERRGAPIQTPSRQKQLFLVEYSVFCASIAGGEGGACGFEGEVKNMAHGGPHQ